MPQNDQRQRVFFNLVLARTAANEITSVQSCSSSAMSISTGHTDVFHMTWTEEGPCTALHASLQQEANILKAHRSTASQRDKISKKGRSCFGLRCNI